MQARVPAIRDLVAKLSRFDHGLVPILGRQRRFIWNQDVCTLCQTTVTVDFSSHWLQLSPEVLDLHNRFECGGNWGLERTFHAWVNKQPWRQLMPVSYFGIHDVWSHSYLNGSIFHSSIGLRFDVPAAPVSWLLLPPTQIDHSDCYPIFATKVRQRYAARIGTRGPVKQSVMLPHDIAASMYHYDGGEQFFRTWVGVPGESCQFRFGNSHAWCLEEYQIYLLRSFLNWLHSGTVYLLGGQPYFGGNMFWP